MNDYENIQWTEKLDYKPKLRTYKLFKRARYVEKYVTLNLSTKERSLLAQLRMGVLPIHIETGRYTNIPAENRYCFNCHDKIEDEMHFVFDCPLYGTFRETLLKNVDESFNFMTIHNKFAYLCSYFTRQLAKYVCQAYDKRNSLLYTSN